MSLLKTPLLNMLLEMRAGAEIATLPLTLPWLDQAPMGDNHPVMVVPGFSMGDTSTHLLRRFL